jgi:hypothetical protein
MPVNREPGTVKNYTIWGGGFGGGLFNSINGSLIPDNCLADMSNLHVDHFGVLHSVTKPVENTDCYASALSGPIRAVMGSWANLFINRNGTLYNEANQTDTYAADAVTTQVADSPAGVGRFYVTYTNGLYNAASGTATNIEYADEDILTGGESPASSTICEFEGRIWLNLGSRLRGSDLTDPSLEESWRGPVDPVDGTTMTLANCLIVVKMPQLIRHLIKMNGALFIFCDDGIYQLSTFFDGVLRPVYLGAALPRWGTGAPFRIYTDGQIAYYVSDNKFYAFSGTTPQCISDHLSLSSALCWFAGEYDGRIWFLTSTVALPSGSQVNYIYAVDKTTGAWEKYDVQMTAAASPNIDTPTALMGGEDRSVGVRGDRLWLGTSLGKVFFFSPTATGTPLAWSFTTKTYTPSFDAYSRFQHFKIRYVGQALTSPVTITQHVCRDGVDATTDTLVERKTATTLDMVGAGGGMFQKDIECHADLGEGVYFTVSGTGTCEIADIGVEFSMKGANDVNA